MAKLLTISEYAAHRGVSHPAVQKAIDRGRISSVLDPEGKRRMIDPDVADAEWERNTNPQKRKGGDAVREKYQRERDEPALEDDDDEPIDESEIPPYAKSLAVKEHFRSELVRLQYEEKLGSLVSADDVKREAYAQGRVLRERLYSIPDRIAATLAAELDPHRIHLTLTAELQSILEEVVDDDGTS